MNEMNRQTINMNWFLYFARCLDKSLYIGISQNPNKRIKVHNRGNGCAWIKQHGTAEIVYLEKFKTYKQARKREIQVKKWGRIKKENLIKYGRPKPEKLGKSI